MSFLRPSDEPSVAVRQLARWLEVDDPMPLLIETSGSTGQPKGVVLQRDAVVASAEASARRLQGSGRWYLALPSSYVAGVQVIVRSLLAGHEPSIVDGLRIARAAAHDRSDAAAFISLVPTQLHRILRDPDLVKALSRFHTVLVGGGGLDPQLRARAEEKGIHVVATYGSSETAGGCVYDGRPLDGVELALDDKGRVRIGGPTLFSHYDDDPQLTAECLVGGWFLTSDTGRFDETGRLQITGRIDDVVVSGGVKIPAPAVAERLRQHPLVEEAEVLGVPDAEWGHRVVAVLVGTAADPELRDWVGMVHPRSWAPSEFVWVDELPRLRNGKIDLQAVRAAL